MVKFSINNLKNTELGLFEEFPDYFGSILNLPRVNYLFVTYR